MSFHFLGVLFKVRIYRTPVLKVLTPLTHVTPKQSLKKSKEKNKTKVGKVRVELQTMSIAAVTPKHYTMSRTVFS